MAFAVGTAVANIYYNQPLLDQIRASFGVSLHEIAWIPSLTQAGYAIGMLFIVPLGDMRERKRLVLLFSCLSALTLALVACAPGFFVAAIASLMLGLSTMTPQFLIPFAASLAEPHEKGKVVGTMMSGLLLGILLARTVSGFVGAAYGWRAMFGLASAFQVLLVILLAFTLPKSEPSYHGKYLGLLQSVLRIFKEQTILREASFFGAMLFGAFSAFWATLIYLMQTPTFHLGARAVGIYGLLGAVAAGFTPVVGGLVDRHPARKVTGIMMALTLFSFLVFGLSASSLVGIGIGVILMDVGVQGGHVSNQSRILSLIPGAQSRLQTAYMFFYFLGGAIGSYLGTVSFGHYGWSGVCCSAGLLMVLGLLRYSIPTRKHPQV